MNSICRVRRGSAAPLAELIASRFIDTLLGCVVGLVGGVDHRPETARVVQAQHTSVGHQVHVVVRARFGLCGGKVQAARHAQMDKQKPLVQIEQQVFSAPAHAPDLPPHQALGRHAQRPAQGLAHVQGQDLGRGNAVGKTATGDFNFGEFGHGLWCKKGLGLHGTCQRVAGL